MGLGGRMLVAMLVAFLTLWAVMAGGCATASIRPTTTVPHGTEDARRVALGGTTSIALSSNPSTGFGWSLDTTASTGLGHIALADEGFIRSDSGLVGAPGRRWWRVTGVSAGRASVVFVYRRAWEQETPPAKRRTVVIDVR